MTRIAARASRLLLLAVLATAAPAAAQVLRVPQDVGNLQQAIDQVPDGGVIELAAGVYPSPSNGFRIGNERKGFTVRAAAGAQVVLDGEGGRPVLRFENSNPSRGERVFFRGLTFRNGRSEADKVGGALTLVAADAAFIDCAFEDSVSAAPGTGGGAALIHDGSLAVFVDSDFRGNSAVNRGGAMEVFDSVVYLHGGRVEGNRVNLPGHRVGAVGGGVHLIDGTLRVSDAHFEDNQSGWVGGAIFAIGVWTEEPDLAPASELLISNTTFVDNRAEADPGSPAPGVTAGGAIHVEDQTTLRVFGSRFRANRAEQAGAVNGYRTVVEIADSVFQGNVAASDERPAVGGAIYLNSLDFADASTGFGAVNRRPARLTAVRTLFQGDFDGAGATAEDGGCVSVDGDIFRLLGGGGVEPEGGVAANRARVVLDEVVFFDCDVADDGIAGFGGALQVKLVDLTLTGSLVLDSDSLHPAPTGGGGGGAAVLIRSKATIDDTVFAGNTASRGAGLFVNGSEIDVAASAFIANEVTPGVAENAGQSRGAAIFSLPRLGAGAADVTGVVADTLFALNVGVPIFDFDRGSAPVNRLRYDGNRFFSTTFGPTIYVNNLAAPGGLSVAALNSLVVPHSGTAAADKSEVANQALGSAPAEGKVLAVPPSLSRFGDPAAAPTSLAAFLWSGGSATFDGQAVADRTGLVEVAQAKTYRLRVGGAQVASDAVGPENCSSRGMLCINGERFLIDTGWTDFRGRTGIGTAVPLTGDTGYFFFFDPANVELVSKVLDGRALTGHYWLFYGALSNVEYEIRGLDTVTGFLRTYANPSGNFASVGDTRAFPADAGGVDSARPQEAGEGAVEDLSGELAGSVFALPAAPEGVLGAEPPGVLAAPRQTGTCVPSPTNLCLGGGRFHVEIDWTDFGGRSGVGMAVPLSDDTGYFFFFFKSNVEVVLKVLDGTPINGHYWVFYGALSNVEYHIRVTDTETGFVKTYDNPLRNFASVGDTRAIPEEP